MKHLLIIVNLLFINIQLYAQFIKGQVIDQNSNPIDFANVVLMKDSTFVTGTITDTNDFFEIANTFNQDNSIAVSAIGYSKRIMKIPPTGELGTIILEEDEIKLSEVVIKTKSPLTRLKEGALVTTIETV